MKTRVRSLRAVLVAGLAVTLLAGCEHFARLRRPKPPAAIPVDFASTPSPEPAPLDPALLQRPNSEYRLGPGDQLDIEVLGDVDTRQQATVGPDGKIYFYILPGIDVWGLTIPQAREKLAQEMQRFVREPQPISMTLRAAESQRVWILGRLNKPGVYSMAAPMTLLEAISDAGGPAPASAAASLTGTMSATGDNMMSDAADLSRAFIIRQGRMLRVDFARLLRDGDMSQNIYLQPDDFVYLPSASVGDIHVLGAVTTPRSIAFNGNLTLAEAVAEAGGTIRRQAYLSRVAIVRGSLAQPKVAIVDLDAILKGQAPDVQLEAQDIVYVPNSPYRVLNRYVDTILDTFVRTVGVNEGARAVSGNAQPLSVTVPLGGR